MATTSILDALSNDFDYERWAPMVKARLVEKGLWNVVENGILPDPMEIPDLATSEQTEFDDAEWRDSVRSDTKALQIIRASLTKPIFMKTLSVSSAKDLWDLLKKDCGEAKPRGIGKQFDRSRMTETNIDVDAAFHDLDYDTVWAPNMKRVLVNNGLWDVVENGVPPDLSESPELDDDVRYEELFKWITSMRKDSKAIQVMLFDLPESDLRYFLSSFSAKDLWELFKEGSKQTKVTRLKKKFEQLRMEEEGETLDFYLDRVFEVTDELRLLGNAKSDYEVIEKVLSSLSGSYDNVAPLVEAVGDMKTMKLNSFVNFVYKYESITEEATAMTLKDLKLKSEYYKWYENNHNEEECNTVSRTREARPRGGVCLLCWEGGHYARDCKRKNQLQVAAEAQKDEVKVDSVMVAEEEVLGDITYDEDMWLVYSTSDSGTNHMTPYEKYFTTLDRTYKAKVGSVNGKVLMVEGRGDVKIMMKEGKTKTIKNVQFVPGLKRNVLSLGQLKARGYSTKTEAGKFSFHDRTGAEFGETSWDMRGLVVRLQVIEANLTS